MAYRLVIFDLDGTLVDSAGCVLASLERALAACGCPFDGTQVRPHIGEPLEGIVAAASPSIEPRALGDVVEAYGRHYAALERDLVRPFPGALATLERLRVAGVRLAVATNRIYARARSSLDRLGVAASFDVIVAADGVSHPKPHPAGVHRVLDVTGVAPAETLMVGDTVWDIEMATRASVASCAVTWGYHDAARLARSAPSHRVDTFEDLEQIVSTN